MFLPIRTDSPLHSTPWMNWLLMAANGGVFALQVVHPSLTDQWGLAPQTVTLEDLFFTLTEGDDGHEASERHATEVVA